MFYDGSKKQEDKDFLKNGAVVEKYKNKINTRTTKKKETDIGKMGFE